MSTKPFYIHQKPPAQSFIRLPNFLFEAPSFCSLSSEAKLLYAMILRRTDLSRKNGWADDYGKIYLYYPINEVCELLHCGRQKAVDTLRELQYADSQNHSPLRIKPAANDSPFPRNSYVNRHLLLPL